MLPGCWKGCLCPILWNRRQVLLISKNYSFMEVTVKIITRQIFTSILEEPTASIFRLEDKPYDRNMWFNQLVLSSLQSFSSLPNITDLSSCMA